MPNTTIPTKRSPLGLLTFSATTSTVSSLLFSSFKLFVCCLLVSAILEACNVFSKLCSLSISLSFECGSLSPSTNIDVIHESSIAPRSQFLARVFKLLQNSSTVSPLCCFRLMSRKRLKCLDVNGAQ